MTTAVQAPAIGNELSTLVKTGGLQGKSAQDLIDAFLPLVGRLENAIADGLLVQVRDENDKEGMKAARTQRLAMREIRLEVEANRKRFKEDALRTGQAIDGIARLFTDRIKPVEARLQELEDTAELAATERKNAIIEARSAKLRLVRADPTVYPLGEMSEEAFANLLEGATLKEEKRIADEKKAIEEREAAAKAQREEADRIKAENERLRKEQAERDAAAKAERDRLEALAAAERAAAQRAADEAAAKARAEREAAEADARKEREAREKLEREAAEARRIEAARVEAERKAADKAAQAPDREKIVAVAVSLRSIVIPGMATDAGRTRAQRIRAWIDELAKQIDTQAEQL